MSEIQVRDFLRLMADNLELQDLRRTVLYSTFPEKIESAIEEEEDHTYLYDELVPSVRYYLDRGERFYDSFYYAFRDSVGTLRWEKIMNHLGFEKDDWKNLDLSSFVYEMFDDESDYLVNSDVSQKHTFFGMSEMGPGSDEAFAEFIEETS